MTSRLKRNILIKNHVNEHCQICYNNIKEGIERVSKKRMTRTPYTNVIEHQNKSKQGALIDIEFHIVG